MSPAKKPEQAPPTVEDAIKRLFQAIDIRVDRTSQVDITLNPYRIRIFGKDRTFRSIPFEPITDDEEEDK